MSLFQILAGCPEDMVTILDVVKAGLNVVRWVIPIILIVLGTIDISKAVTAQDEKQTKEAQKRFTTRAIYAVVIFLIPTIISLIFTLLPDSTFGSEVDGYTWKDCWFDEK